MQKHCQFVGHIPGPKWVMFTHSPPTIVSRFAPLYGRREHFHCGRPILCHIHRRTLLMKPQLHRAVRWQSDSLKTKPTVHRSVHLLLKSIKHQFCRLHDCTKPRFVCLQFRLRFGQGNHSYVTWEVPIVSAYISYACSVCDSSKII